MNKLRKQLHISGMNTMADCQMRWKFRYVDNIKRPPNAYLLVGSATDESATKNLQNKIDTQELLPRQDAIGIAEAKFDADKDKEPIELDVDEKREGRNLADVLGEARDKTMNLAGLHYDKAAPIIRPSVVRRRFSIDMDAFLRQRAKALHNQADQVTDNGTAKLLHNQASKLNAAAREGMDFAGEMDIVEQWAVGQEQTYLSIRDTKTASKSPTKGYLDGHDSPGIADDSNQLDGYAVATKVLDGKLPDMMTLDFLIQTPARRDLNYVPRKTTRTMDDVNVFLNRFANAVQAIRTGMFVPTNPTDWRCSQRWCGYFDICEFAKRPKLIQITKEIPSENS